MDTTSGEPDTGNPGNEGEQVPPGVDGEPAAGHDQAPDPAARAAELEVALAEREAELLARTETEQAMLTRLREALLASDPEVDPELVTGSTIAQLEESFERAKAISERLRGIILAPGVQRVPAGAPGRTPPGPRTAFEKIREGLRTRS